MKHRIITAILLFASNLLIVQAQQLAAYPAPTGAELNPDFTTKVRLVNGNWENLPNYQVKVDRAAEGKHNVELASMSYFDFSGEVEITVTYNGGSIQTARIRPLFCNIQPEINGNTLTFKLNQPRNLSIEVNGDIFHNLHLFANPVDNFKPDKEDKNLIYFGAGIHTPEKGSRFVIPSGKTVYVAGGAVLKGQISINNVRDVKVLGRGIIDIAVKEGIRIEKSKNVYVEGVTLTQIPVGNCDSVFINNVKSISYYGWGDGMNVFASNNVHYENVFCRNSDDCHTVYATRKGFVGGCKNITMKNSTLWADVAHPIQIGTHGNTEKPDVIENCYYSNIDILDHNEKQIDYQGCLSLNAGDSNFIRDVLFQDIRIEDFREGQLVNLRVFYNTKYCTSPGRGIENVKFKNITYNGNNANISIIAGYDNERKAKNITFENLVINGVHIYDTMPAKPAWFQTGDMARIFVGEHVENVVFK
jgi:hypothetical protein